jgi:hypothetical protein
MIRHVNVVLLVAVAACGPRDSSQVILPPGGVALDSTGSVPRHFLGDTLIMLGHLGGGSDQDTALLDPYLIEANRDHFYIVEGDQRVQAYDTLANRLWVIGRDGSGPGEFRNIRDIKIGPNHEVWVHDPSNARITRLGPSGNVAGFVSVQQVGHSETIVPATATTVTLLPSYADADILTIDTTGTIVDRDTVPWSGYHDLETLSRQFETASDPSTGQWVMGFSFGNGWFAFEGHGGSGRRYYVEPTRFPPVVKEVTNGGATVSSKLVRGDLSAANIALQSDTVFILFGGKELVRQKLDLYSWTSGKYLGTMALPEPVDDIAVSGSFLYTMASHPVPRVVVYRRVRKT